MRRTQAPLLAAVALSVLALVAACSGLVDEEPSVAANGPPAWNHDPADASLGPAGWGSIDDAFEACLTGTNQSPVDIANAVPADLPPLEFSYAGIPVVIENTGHVIEVPISEESVHTLTIGDESYRLVQFHFHAPSEHTVDGVSHDLEAHLVHQNDEGQLAVVGVFLDEGAAPVELVDSVIGNAPEGAGEEVELEAESSPLALLPLEGGTAIVRYSTYLGSLTTPGCTESVRWIVLSDTMGVSSAAADRLHELIAAFPGYDGHDDNNRPIQPLNDREIETSEE
jgi:carbonic anhydrase